MLAKRVRGLNPRAGQASDKEKLSYALCLARIGAPTEAHEIIDSIESSLHVEAHLYKGFSYVVQWDYESAILPFTHFIKKSKSSYQTLVAVINLLSCLVYCGRTLKAIELVEKAENSGELAKSFRLQMNLYEVKAQIHIQRENWQDARVSLEKAESLASEHGTREVLFVKKWRAISNFLESKGTLGLGDIRKIAANIRHFETVRECARYEAVFQKDPASFWHLFFGTPHVCYRETLLKTHPEFGAIPKQFDLKLGNGNPKHQMSLTGKIQRHKVSLLALLGDFFAPIRIAPLHARLFPGEYFNPYTSPKRVHEQVRKMRKWLASHADWVKVVSKDSAYQLIGDGVITVPRPLSANDVTQPFIERIAAIWGPTHFTTTQVSKRLEMSVRTVQRALEREVVRKKILKEGAGSTTCFRIA